MPKRPITTKLRTRKPSKRMRSLTSKAEQDNSDTDHDPEDSPTTHAQPQRVSSSIGHAKNSTHHSAEVHIVQQDTIHDNDNNDSEINQTIAQANRQSIPVTTQTDLLQASGVYSHHVENTPELAAEHFSGHIDPLAVQLIGPPNRDDQLQHTAFTETTILPPYAIDSVVQSDDYTVVNQIETNSFDRPTCENREIELRIVLSGKTGVGKSFLGNRLLRKQLFESRVCLDSITSNCSSGTRTLNDGTIIKVFDTPGFFDTRHKTAELVKHLFSLSSLTAPGPHVFLYLLRADEKLTMENKDSINLFRDIFGAEVNKYVIFVLNRKPKEMDANTIIEQCEFLNTLLKECHFRYVTINFADSDTGVEKCVDNLLQMIRDTIRDNDGKHYSSNIFVEAERSYNEKQELKETQRDMKIQLADKEQEITRLKRQLPLQKTWYTGYMKKECNPMQYRDYHNILRTWPVLLDELNPQNLCIELFNRGVFDKDDKCTIEKIKGRRNKCNKLLMKVLESGRNAFPKFLDALTSTGHGHARGILEEDIHEEESVVPSSMKKERGLMRERDYHKIQRQFPFLLKQLKPLPICIALFSRNVFNADDKDKIEAIEGRGNQCNQLLMKVLESGPNAFPKFLDALTSTGHHHARAVLEGDIQEEDRGDPSHCVVNVNFSETNFDPDYKNRNNHRYKSLAAQLEKAVITELKRNGSGETWAVVVDMRKGSIIVTFVFTTYPKTNSTNLQPIVEQILESGYIGPYKVSRDHFSFCRIEDWQAIPDQIKEDISCQSKDTREQLLWNRLHRANVDGNILEFIKTLSPEDGESAIMMASVAGWYDVVIYLLDHHVYSKEYLTNLLSIILDNYRPTESNCNTYLLQCVVQLVHTGVDLNKCDVANERPLIQAAKQGLVEIVIYLLDHGVEIHCIDAEGHNILHLLLRAIDGTGTDETKCIHVVKELLHRGLDVNQQDKVGNTPMFYIECLANREDVSLRMIHNLIHVLISYGCDVNRQNNQGLTPLMYFIMKQVKVDILRLLITNHAKVDICDNYGNTAYIYCIQYRKHDCIGVLKMLEIADTNLSAKCHVTLLHQILECGRLEIFYYCMGLKMLFKGVTVEGENMLHLLAKVNYDYSQPEFNWLLDIDVDTNQQCPQTNTPIMIASFLLNIKYLEVITHHPNIKINSQNNKGHTALHLCIIGFAMLKDGLNERQLNDVVHGYCERIYPIYLECMNILLGTTNVDVNIQDKGGRTVLMMAATKNDQQMTRLLLEAGAKVNKLDHSGRSALQYLNIYKSNFDLACFRLLLSSDDLDMLDLPCINGNTILQNALCFPLFWDLQDAVAFIRFLVANNCSVQRLVPQNGESSYNLIELSEYREIPQLRRLLYLSGASKSQIISTLRFGMRDNYYEDAVDTFHVFCNSLSLKSLCRRIIRKELGTKIKSNILDLDLPYELNEFLLMEDCLHPRYYTIDFAFPEVDDECSNDSDKLSHNDPDYDSYNFDYEYDVYDDTSVLKVASAPSLKTQCKVKLREMFTNEDINKLTMLPPPLKKFLIIEDVPRDIAKIDPRIYNYEYYSLE